MKTLHLPIKKEFFDAIVAGTKTIEYRAASDYWCERFKAYIPWLDGSFLPDPKYNKVIFSNGYGATVPKATADIVDIVYVEDDYRDPMFEIHICNAKRIQ